MSPEERLAKRFHEIYEQLAPAFAYETRKESAVPWEKVPERNKLLMIAVCQQLMRERTVTVSAFGTIECVEDANGEWVPKPDTLPNSEMNEERLAARAEGRKDGQLLLELCKEAAARLRPLLGQYGADVAFWEEIRDYALTQAPMPPQKPVVRRATPMSDEQAREFEKEEVPFGRFAHMRVGSANPEVLPYLRWLADQTFIDDLRRYLANETTQRQAT